jgi:hypothetical protein
LLLLFFHRAAEMIFGEAVAEEVECVFGSVDELEKIEVAGRNGTPVHERLKVHDAAPVFAAINDDKNFLGQLVGLGEREDFEKLVDGAETAGKITSALAKYANQNLRMKK